MNMKKTISLLLVLCMVLTLLPVGAQAAAVSQLRPTMAEHHSLPQANTAQALQEHQPQTAGSTVTAEQIENPGFDLKLHDDKDLTVEAPYADTDMVRVIVLLEDQGLLERGYTTAQIAANGSAVAHEIETMEQRQEHVLTAMAADVSEFTLRYQYNVMANGLSVEVPYGELETIRAIDGVRTAVVAPQYSVPEDMGTDVSNPELYATKDITGAAMTWENLGYAGEGMRIAVIDTGLDMDHPSFADDPVLNSFSLTKEEIASVMPELNAYKMYSRSSAVPLTADALYRSGKVPYAFNYVDETLDVTHDHDASGDHGTHVAGIAASNRLEGCPVAGVAPEAQLIIMKVFGANGGAYSDDILAALEDCFRLNVNAVNMSVGAPGGFTSEGEAVSDALFAQLKKTDIIASVSAGNSFSAAMKNGYGTDRNLAKDPDNGVISSPASYIGSTVVASLENSFVMNTYFSAGEKKIPYTDVAATPFYTLAGQSYTYVMVPGLGTAADFEGLDVTGKIAVISRGGIAFTEKQENAKNAGAIACIIYDNVDGDLSYMQDAKIMPNIMITKASGAYLAELAVNGEGQLTPAAQDDKITMENPTAGEMSSFSSWGVTPDLRLEPDLTAPGGSIYSTVDNGKYDTMSGTSMSAPHIAGMSALIFQYLRDQYDLEDAQAHTVAEALLMSTATPMVEPTGQTYSPRKQGSGSANIYNAIISPAYLTVNGDSPKVSLGDDDNRTGHYSFSFEINNMTDKALTYKMGYELLTDQVNLDIPGYAFMGETSRPLTGDVDFSVDGRELTKEYDYNADGVVDMADVQALLDAVNGLSEILPGFDFNADAVTNTADAQIFYELVLANNQALDLVEVPANGSVTVHASVALSEEDMAYMDTYYENGIYVDGFVRLYPAEGEVELSLPFMGFYGDWSDADLFDSVWVWDADTVPFNRYPHIVFANFGNTDFYLGGNPYILEPHADSHNVLSPNGDGFMDQVSDIYISLMRNAKKLNFTWSMDDQELFSSNAEYLRKSVFLPQLGQAIPFIYSQYVEDMYDFTTGEGAFLPNNTDLMLTVDGWLDDSNNEVDAQMTLPVHIDTEAPVLYTDEMAMMVNPHTNSRYLEFYVSDNYDIAAVITTTGAGAIIDTLPMDSGEKTLVRLDVSDYDSDFVLAVCDYGCNETYYQVHFEGEMDMDTDSFYGYRRFSVIPNGNYLYATEAFNGWYSFESAQQMLRHTAQTASPVAAAEFVDGYVLAVDMNSQLYAMKAGSWIRSEIGELAIDGVKYPALDMAFDYTTNTLLIVTDELSEGQGGHLVEVDYLTGAVTDLGMITGMPHQALTLACDNDGRLFTVDFLGGQLYSLNRETAEATLIGDTGYEPKFMQSMTVDHETNTLYWAAYQGYTGSSQMFEVNKETAELTAVSAVEANGEMTGVFKPYLPAASLYPEAELTGLDLSQDKLMLSKGRTETLLCTPVPFYAEPGEVTWTTSDPAVAVVDNGVVTTVGAGEAVITAHSGAHTAECRIIVSAFEGQLTAFDMAMNPGWHSFNAAMPEDSQYLEDAMPTNMGYTSAAYHGGWVYVAENGGGFYRMNPATMQGTKLGSSGGSLYAMTFNYADGFMYGMEVVENGFEADSYLVRVNTNTGKLQRLAYLDQDTYGMIMGGLTVDYDGNFYALSNNMMTYETELLTFRVEGDEIVDLDSESFPDYMCQGYSSMLYSHDNGGILWANNEGHLIWIDVTDIHSLKTIDLGSIGEDMGMGMYMGLFSADIEEPEVPYVEPASVQLPKSYLVLEGGTVSAGLMVEPWNASAAAAYSVKDPDIAEVDGNGQITGVKEGTTSLGVYIGALDQTFEVPITVAKPTGDIYGFMLTDFMYAENLWIKVPDAAPGTAELATTDSAPFAVFAGAYYNGRIYGYGQDQSGDLDYKNYFLTIDPADYSVTVGKIVNYTLRDMAFDYTTGTMYAIAQGGLYNGAVAQVDIETGDVTIVAETGRKLASMTIDADGQMYAIAENDILYRVDKNTGALTEVGNVGADASMTYQSMFYDFNSGNTYWAQAAEDQTTSLRLVDLNTGCTTSLGMVAQYGAMMTALFTVPAQEPAIPESAAVSGITMNPHNAVTQGKTVTLNATVLPVSQSSVEQAITWSSDNEAVATVENGVVTGIAAGTANITATAAGYSVSCQVTVFDHDRRFYAYDETNTQWISFAADNAAEVTVERDDAEGETVLAASTLVGDTIYAYAKTGEFYSIDPDTFQRTAIGNGFSDDTYTAIAYDNWTGEEMPIECELQIVDLSYDQATGKLYAAFNAVNDDYYIRLGLIYEVDVATGEATLLTPTGRHQPANLLAIDHRVFFVDSLISGILVCVDMNLEEPIAEERALVQGYWGDYADGRGFIQDACTGTVYVVRDTMGGESTLYTMNLGDAHILPVGLIGQGLVVNSLILK